MTRVTSDRRTAGGSSKFGCGAALGLLLLAGTPALQAQVKPDPPAPAPDPATLGPDLNKFRAAYERAESPTILVLVERSVASGAKPAEGEGAFRSIFDESGDTYILKASIEEWLRKVQEVELVNMRNITNADKRDVSLLGLSGERDAIALLAHKINAGIVLLVKMQPTTQHSASYRCTVETIDVPRGRTLDAFAFDWREGLDAGTIKAYAQRITRKFVDGFDNAYGVNTTAGTARTFTLMLVGVNMEQRKAAVDAFKRIPGMFSVTPTQATTMQRNGRNESVTEIRAKFVGSTFDFAYEIQSTAKRALGLEVSDPNWNGGTLSLIAREARKPEERPAQDRVVLLNEDSKEGDKTRENLRSQYRERNSPRIALLINRELTDEEAREAGAVAEGTTPGAGAMSFGAGGPVYVNIAGDVRVGAGGGTVSRPAGDPRGGGGGAAGGSAATEELDTRQVENEMYDRFGRAFGFKMIDPGTARNSIMKDASKARRVYQENELVYLLKEQNIAEVIILGSGRIRRDGGKMTPEYTFRAIRLSDAEVLGTANVAADRFTFGESADIAKITVAEIAREAASRLADAMWAKWSPPNPLRIRLERTKSDRDAFRIRDALKENIAALRHVNLRSNNDGVEGGIAEFDAEYLCSFDELLRGMLDIQSKLPFEFDRTKATPESITIRLRETQ